MRRISSVIVCVSLLLAGCKAKELVDKASVSKDLQKRGTIDLMKEVGNDHYAPPTDGRLTEAQIQMYLKVREHEKTIAKVAREELKQHAANADKKEKSIAGMMEGFKAMGSAADFVTADLRAAKDLGYNSQEYLWVKTQILAASTSVMAENVNQTLTANFDKAYADAKKAYDEAKDEQTKKLYGDMLASYAKSRQEMTTKVEEDPALTYNRQLLSKHENALNAYAHELAKFEDKEGDVQKSMEELQKKFEEAKKQ
jgi:hypothetical protein